MTGTLYICATPIGNLGDISHRVLEVLNQVDLIAAEDTRHSGLLLKHFGIQKPLISYHEHNQKERTGPLLERLLGGESVALISDAGTPLISDPGAILVREATLAGIPVTSLPGPSALITALTLSGLPAGRFVFEGFLPVSGSQRSRALEGLKEEPRTLILYEAPHRLYKTLEDLLAVLGPERPLALCRELTKLHETVLRGSLGEILEIVKKQEPRGEYVLVLGGLSAEESARQQNLLWESQSPEAHLQAYMERGMTKKEAMKAMASDFGISKNQIYNSLKSD